MKRNKYKILLVEDEANIRNLVATMLDTSGYQTLLAQSCSEAQMLYASYLPDLIVLDLGLPDMDGMNLLEFVRHDSLTPIIVLSARTDEADKIAALDAGANDYITKPFGAGELLARVRAALRNNRFSSEEGRLPGRRFVLKELQIDYDARLVFIRDDPIKLTQTEYNLGWLCPGGQHQKAAGQYGQHPKKTGRQTGSAKLHRQRAGCGLPVE